MDHRHGNVTVEACDDDAGISQIKGDWQPLRYLATAAARATAISTSSLSCRKAEPVGTIISSKSGKELTKQGYVLCGPRQRF